MGLKVVVLGCNSAIPSQGRHPSAQVVQVYDQRYLIDAGEGTQLQCAQFRQSPMKISKIFISHLHGDHVFGLPGLLTTMNLQGRTASLDIFGPAPLKKMMLDFLNCSCVQFHYPVSFHAVTTRDKCLVTEDAYTSVYAFPLDHKVETYGYLFVEKLRFKKLNVEILNRLSIPKEDRSSIVHGEDWTNAEGVVYPNAELTLPPRPAKAYAYCSDTRYTPHIAPWIKGATLLYHEATYLHEMVDKATDRGHSTALQAAEIAGQAEVERLLLGHFSSKYRDLTPLVEEARSVFPAVEAAEEGKAYEW